MLATVLKIKSNYQILGLYWISALAAAKNRPFFTNPAQIRRRPKMYPNFGFQPDLQNGAYKYFNVPYFNYFQKTVQPMLPYFWFVCLLCWDLTITSRLTRSRVMNANKFKAVSWANDKSGPVSGWIYIVKSGEIRHWPDLQNLNPVHPYQMLHFCFKAWAH